MNSSARRQGAFWRPVVFLAAVWCAGCGPATRVDRHTSAWPLARDKHPAHQDVDKAFMKKVAKDPFPTAQERGLFGM
ncbi:MAG: hypothetical protein WD847_20900 [Pirellulales bacterium]